MRPAAAAVAGRPVSAAYRPPDSSFLFRDGRLCGLHSRAQGTFLVSVAEQRRVWSAVFRHRHLLKDRPAASYQGLFAAFQRAFERGDSVALCPGADAFVVAVCFVHLGVEHELHLTLRECVDNVERDAFRWHLMLDMCRALDKSRSAQQSLQAQLHTAQRGPPRSSSPPQAAVPERKPAVTRQGHPPRRQPTEPGRWRPVNTTRPALIAVEEKPSVGSGDALAAEQRRRDLNAATKAGWCFAMTEGKMRMQQKLLEQQAMLSRLCSQHEQEAAPQLPDLGHDDQLGHYPSPPVAPPTGSRRSPAHSRPLSAAVVHLPTPGVTQHSPAPTSDRQTHASKRDPVVPSSTTPSQEWGFAPSFLQPATSAGVLRAGSHSSRPSPRTLGQVSGEQISREGAEGTAKAVQRSRVRKERALQQQQQCSESPNEPEMESGPDKA
eukprot:TRINITY_DN30183_c0_g1_i1.p1 TRINITY_DN30183_c0_g1~~TRINITY_DN30183_c0_g1_i1.p1  ORF type:complete len:453 (+),score=88.78 TRINITY_DN30183_c0_g1_i1:52-1359(+)